MTAKRSGVNPSTEDPGVLGITEAQRRLATKNLLRHDRLDCRQMLGLDRPVIEPDEAPETLRPHHHTGFISGARRVA